MPVKSYSVADGLLRDAVYKIKQDSRGFLWFCTVEGVSRFDGYAFTNLTTDDGLPDRHVNDFLETRDGTIYFATDGGLARLNPGGVKTDPANKPNPLLSVILPDDPGGKIDKCLISGRGRRYLCRNGQWPVPVDRAEQACVGRPWAARFK